MTSVSETIQKWRLADLDYNKQTHCANFVIDVVTAKTGKSPVPASVLKAKGAKALLRQRDKVLDGKTLEEYLDARFTQINPLEAEEGDIVVFPADDVRFLDYSLGVAAGAGYVAAFVPLPDGRPPKLLIDRALDFAVKAWRVEKQT